MMLNREEKDTNRWKIEQIEYFKRYLENFNANTKEYRLIKQGIEELERGL